jgi:hypothetical protein
MIITGKALPRRTVLRGLGACLALPLLDSMVPALAAAPTSPRRMAIVYVPMGAYMKKWTPPSDGPLEFSPILRVLEPFREQTLVFSGLANKEADARDGGGQHSRIQPAWLTGVLCKRTEGPDLHVGVSMDQIAARDLGSHTQLASLELGLESVDLLGACDIGYTCAYTATMCWRGPQTPLPMENNPRAVFERLFGTSDSTDPKVRLADIRKNRSILDAVTHKVTKLMADVGPQDSAKLNEYLDSVRDIERRIQKAEEQVAKELPVVEQPAGAPTEFADYAKLMFDLLALAYQCDLTRIATFMVGRELSTRTFPEIGVPDQHHSLSHHQDNIEKLEKQAKLNVYHLQLFTHFLEKLRATPDGDGSLLDHSMILYGSGMSNSNFHYPYDVPTLMVNGRDLGIAGNRHLRYPHATPLTNLHLTMLDKMGVRVDTFGDSTGQLNLLGV